MSNGLTLPVNFSTTDATGPALQITNAGVNVAVAGTSGPPMVNDGTAIAIGVQGVFVAPAVGASAGTLI